MNVIKKYIDINGFSRSGKKRSDTLGIVMHNIGVPNQGAEVAIAYFNSLKFQDAMDAKPDTSASAQYVIDLNGDIYRTMEEDEKAYHCGSSLPDPASKKIYTDLAREKFGRYASNPTTTSPNSCTVGIEMCHKADGFFTSDTIASAVELCKYLCNKYQLTEQDIVTHNEVVGWKSCPDLWTKRPAFLMAFKEDVRRKL